LYSTRGAAAQSDVAAGQRQRETAIVFGTGCGSIPRAEHDCFTAGEGRKRSGYFAENRYTVVLL
jgi:hypothetical protein